MFELTTTMMKRSKFLIVLTLLVVSVSFWQCGTDSAPAPNPQDEQLTKLSHTWKATSVTFGASPVTGYENFTITVSGTAGQATFDYTVAGRPAKSPWPAAGKFTFGTDFSTIIIREDIASDPFTYSVSATQLQLNFNYNGPIYDARVSNVTGDWSFNFEIVN